MSQVAERTHASTASAPRLAPELGYFQRKFPAFLILASFFLVTLPLCLLAWGDDQFVFRRSIGIAYICVFGMTHFVITFVIYLQATNVRYFLSTRANRLTYFVVPAVIFIFFDLYHALAIAAAAPLFDFVLRGGIRLMDFQHFTRQNYGVLQLFRMRSGERFPDWMRKAENAFCWGLTLLLFKTFLNGGRFHPEQPIVVLLLVAVVGLFVAVLVGFARTAAQSAQPSALIAPLAYFVLQTAAAGLAVYSTWLYSFSLAMHYVEYHVLMVPRCFDTPLDDQAPTDRWLGRLRRHRLLFYGFVLVLAIPVTRFAFLGMSAISRVDDSSFGVPWRLLIAVFDGLFVFHYVIESRIWKFTDPYYRKSLVPLYFRPARPPAAPSAGPRPTADEPARVS